MLDVDADDVVGGWLEPVSADLHYRALIPIGDADAVEWDWLQGVDESLLFSELQRLWLNWRDQIIRDGTRDPDAVANELLKRQREWAHTPNVLVRGDTPKDAVARERARSQN